MSKPTPVVPNSSSIGSPPSASASRSGSLNRALRSSNSPEYRKMETLCAEMLEADSSELKEKISSLIGGETNGASPLPYASTKPRVPLPPPPMQYQEQRLDHTVDRLLAKVQITRRAAHRLLSTSPSHSDVLPPSSLESKLPDKSPQAQPPHSVATEGGAVTGTCGSSASPSIGATSGGEIPSPSGKKRRSVNFAPELDVRRVDDPLPSPRPRSNSSQEEESECTHLRAVVFPPLADPTASVAEQRSSNDALNACVVAEDQSRAAIQLEELQEAQEQSVWFVHQTTLELASLLTPRKECVPSTRDDGMSKSMCSPRVDNETQTASAAPSAATMGVSRRASGGKAELTGEDVGTSTQEVAVHSKPATSRSSNGPQHIQTSVPVVVAMRESKREEVLRQIAATTVSASEKHDRRAVESEADRAWVDLLMNLQCAVRSSKIRAVFRRPSVPRTASSGGSNAAPRVPPPPAQSYRD